MIGDTEGVSKRNSGALVLIAVLSSACATPEPDRPADDEPTTGELAPAKPDGTTSLPSSAPSRVDDPSPAIPALTPRVAQPIVPEPAPDAPTSARAASAPLWIEIDPGRRGEVWSKDEKRWVRAEWTAGFMHTANTTFYGFAATIVRFEGLRDAWWYETLDWTQYGVRDDEPHIRTPSPPAWSCLLVRKKVYTD